MSLEERQRMRDKLRKLDEEGATEHDSHNWLASLYISN
jgi:hypothetical protein